jgi:hypothetical protein
VALSRQERRALREIEEHLADEDPALAGLLRPAGGTPLAQLTRGGKRGGVTAAVMLFLGLFLIDAGVLSGWLLMLMIFLSALCPSALLLVFVVLGRDR